MMLRRSKRNDPRRRSFFDTPAHLKSKKRSRKDGDEVANENENVEQVEVTTVEGFTFKKKRKVAKKSAKKPAAKKAVKKAAKKSAKTHKNPSTPEKTKKSAPKPHNEATKLARKVVQQKSLDVEMAPTEKKNAKATEKKNTKPTAAPLPKKAEPPAYPKIEFVAPTKVAENAPAWAPRRFFGDILQNECEQLAKVYTGDFKYLADASQGVSNIFLDKLEEVFRRFNEVKKKRLEKSHNKIRQQNEDLLARIKCVESEIADLESTKDVLTRQTITDKIAVQQDEFKSRESKECRVEKPATDSEKVTKQNSELLKVASIKGDAALSKLRKTLATVKAAQKVAVKIKDVSTKEDLAPFGDLSDPKDLIRNFAS